MLYSPARTSPVLGGFRRQGELRGLIGFHPTICTIWEEFCLEQY